MLAVGINGLWSADIVLSFYCLGSSCPRLNRKIPRTRTSSGAALPAHTNILSRVETMIRWKFSFQLLKSGYFLGSSLFCDSKPTVFELLTKQDIWGHPSRAFSGITDWHFWPRSALINQQWESRWFPKLLQLLLFLFRFELNIAVLPLYSCNSCRYPIQTCYYQFYGTLKATWWTLKAVTENVESHVASSLLMSSQRGGKCELSFS